MNVFKTVKKFQIASKGKNFLERLSDYKLLNIVSFHGRCQIPLNYIVKYSNTKIILL